MNVDVPQARVGDVPVEFGSSASATSGSYPLLLDVREDDEWQRGHAADARHIPMGEVPARLNEIDPQATLYVICKGGGRSQKVAQFLAGNGYEPVNVAGGMLAWANAGRPVVTDGPGPAQVV